MQGHRIVSLRGVLQQLDGDVRAGRTNGLRAIPTGFSPLDTYLHGGVRAGELLLVGGAQGVGKSTWALQLARHVAAGAALGSLGTPGPPTHPQNCPPPSGQCRGGRRSAG